MNAALIPMKDLAGAKGRLGTVLSDGERQALALAMLLDVIEAARESAVVEVIAVVSGDPRVLWQARETGVWALPEPPGGRGLNAALAAGVIALSSARPDLERLLVLPADVPLAAGEDVRRLLLATEPPPAVALAAAVDGGTNGLALAPADAFAFRFGPGSASLHQQEALARGVRFTQVDAGGLALDVDGPEDLRALADARPGGRTGVALAPLLQRVASWTP